MANENQRGEIVAASSDPVAPATGPTAAPRVARAKARATDARATDGVKRATAAPHVQPRRAERRPEMIRQRREDRRREYERRQRQWLYTRIGLSAFALIVVAGVGYGVFRWIQDETADRPEGTVEYSYAGGGHTADLSQTVQYSEFPPVGGDHAPSPYWQNCGFYDAPIQHESAVHSLEHGAVWLTYRPDLPPEQVNQLRELADDNNYLLVSPYPDQSEPVVATAWNNQLRLDSVDDERLDQFVRYFQQGPQTPERGAACTGGVGDPL